MSAMLEVGSDRGPNVHDARGPSGRSRPVVAILEPGGPSIRSGVAFMASALSRPGLADILVCPWYAVTFEGGAVAVRGDMSRFAGDSSNRVHIDTALPVDTLITRRADKSEFPTSSEEQEGLDALVAIGVVPAGVDFSTAIDALLCEAGRRGVATNARELDGQWRDKDRLELMLRADERGGGQRVRRPSTVVATMAQLPGVVRRLARAGNGSIVKPARRSQGRGIEVVGPEAAATWAPSTAEDRYVVQALVEDPLLVDGNKIDLRCHLIVDPDDREGSRLVEPLLMRRAGAPFAPAVPGAEIVNVDYQHREGLPAEIRPIEQWGALPGDQRTEIRDRLAELVDALLDAHTRWRGRVVAPERHVPRRVLLWGVDVVVARAHAGLDLYLLEVNDCPSLLRASEPANEETRRLLGSDYLPALLAKGPRAEGLGVRLEDPGSRVSGT